MSFRLRVAGRGGDRAWLFDENQPMYQWGFVDILVDVGKRLPDRFQPPWDGTEPKECLDDVRIELSPGSPLEFGDGIPER